MDWFSRFVLAWELSNPLDGETRTSERRFCVQALERALWTARPGIFHSDQGSQFTSGKFTGLLEEAKIPISMDGRARFWDNIFVERLWRSVKYEEVSLPVRSERSLFGRVFLYDYSDGAEAARRLNAYFRFYNTERLHQALDYRTPEQVYREART